jgi:hypothetical protein
MIEFANKTILARTESEKNVSCPHISLILVRMVHNPALFIQQIDVTSIPSLRISSRDKLSTPFILIVTPKCGRHSSTRNGTFVSWKFPHLFLPMTKSSYPSNGAGFAALIFTNI